MSQNFRLFHVSNLSVRNFRIFLLMYTGSVLAVTEPAADGLVTLSRAGELPRWSVPEPGPPLIGSRGTYFRAALSRYLPTLQSPGS